MAYPAAPGRETLRTDRRNARPRPCTDGLPLSVPHYSSSCSPGMGCLSFYCAPCMAQRSGGKGGMGESPAQKHGAVFADRLPNKRTARASGVFTDALTTVPIKRQWPLRQSAD